MRRNKKLILHLKFNEMKKITGFLMALVLFVGCNDLDPYDEEQQLIDDINRIDEFLELNSITAQEHISGIRYVITEVSNGDSPVAPNIVAADYDLYRFTGELIDTSNEDIAKEEGIYNPQRDYCAFRFQIGSGTVIPGFEIATQILSEGASGDFYIPSVLAYKNIGSGNIGANENLLFRITLRKARVEMDDETCY
jgi:hypothetical protein